MKDFDLKKFISEKQIYKTSTNECELSDKVEDKGGLMSDTLDEDDSMGMTDDEYVTSESSPLPDMDKVLFDYAKRSDVDKKEFILLLKDHIKHLTKEFENTSYLP